MQQELNNFLWKYDKVDRYRRYHEW